MVPVTSVTTATAETTADRTGTGPGTGSVAAGASPDTGAAAVLRADGRDREAGYVLRTATADDLGGARAVMLDTVYNDLKSGYVPRWHADIIDPEAAYLRPERCTLLVVEHRGEIVATGAVRDRGPQTPPNPRWVADRFPSGTTAQLCRIYVRPDHRRHGLARRMVRALGEFAVRAGGYESLYLHTDPAVPGAEPFWRSLAREVCDERTLPGGGQGIIHFELPMPGIGGRDTPAG
ncbi:GNAT family N-acetyltransferase [Streptomyces californicus]|uniref:GNAT family N-acetyltransferase n=1 Tax=Streptomyces californicus TaxID=67351 RepID=UPI0036C05078